MDDTLARRSIAAAIVLLTMCLASNFWLEGALADAADDQYAVAAAHYSRERWALAVEEFEAFLADHPTHARAGSALFYLAESLVHAERYADAHARFRDYVARYPDAQHVRHAAFRAAESSYLLGQRDDARRELEAFREKYADDELNAYVLTYLGDLALAEKDHALAAQFYERSLKDFPEGPLVEDCRFGLARTWQERGEVERAEPVFTALAEQTDSPLSDEAQFQLGACRYTSGDYAAAEKILATFDTDRRESPLRAKAQLARGWALFHLERYGEASALFEAIATHPQWGIEAGYWLGLVAKAEGAWSAAAERLQACAARAADHPLAAAIHYHAADSLIRAGHAAAALDEIAACEAADTAHEWADDCLLSRIQAALATNEHETVVRLAAEFDEKFAASEHAGEATRAVARSLLDQRDFAAAIERLEPLVTSDTATAASIDRYLLALAYQGAARHEEAVGVLANLADDDPRLRTEADLVEGTSLAALARYEEAIARLERYLAARAEDEGAARCRAQLAVCCARATRIDDARRWFTELREKHAGDSVLPHATSHLAEAVYAAGEFAWSAELFAQLAKLETTAPHDAEAPPGAALGARGLAGLGWSHYQQGDLAAASAEFARVVEQFPADAAAAEAALMLGRIEAERGAPARALASYKRVIENYPDSAHLADALRGAARLHEQLSDHQQAALLYERLVNEHAATADADAVLYEWSWVRRALDEHDAADALLERLRSEHATSRFFADATYRLAERAHQRADYARASALLGELTANENTDAAILEHALYLAGQVAAAREAWSDAEAPLTELIEKFPDGKLRLLAEYWRAEASYRLGRSDEALERFDELLAKTLDSQESWMPMVALRRAQIFAARREWLEALELASQIADEHPNFAQQYEVDYLLGRCHASQAQFDKAREAYGRAVNSATGGKTETAAMAQWMIGETYFHQKNYRAAIKEYLRVEILYAYPEWQAAALLQAAKCHEQLDQWNEASELYARLLTNYGQTSYTDEAATRAGLAQQKSASLPPRTTQPTLTPR